jgi:hypothetical protein
MATYRDWRELPFREIWCVDTEYYPGPGKANGGKDGDTITPLCLVAHEMRTGRLIRLWQDELGPFPPYRLDQDAVFISYLLPAEYGFHIARGWGEPARALDAFVEYRHYVNDGALKAEDRDKRFYSLAGALRYFCEDPVDTAHKKEMQDRILQGPPFTHAGARKHPGILRRGYPQPGAPGRAPGANRPLARARAVPGKVSVGHGQDPAPRYSARRPGPEPHQATLERHAH